MPRSAPAEKKNFHERVGFIPSGHSFTPESEALRRLARSYGFEEIPLSCIEEEGIAPSLERGGLCRIRRPIAFPAAGAVLRFSGALSLLGRYASLGLGERPHPLKVFFSGPVFFSSGDEGAWVEREECGVAVIGEASPIAEATVAHVLWKALHEQGNIPGIAVEVNQTGCSQCRPHLRSALLASLRPRTGRLCPVCRDEVRQNPFRIFGCSEEQCRAAAEATSQTLDFLCEGCRKHLRGFLEFLDEAALPYSLNNRLFREGLWFNGLLFEFAPVKEGGLGDAHPEVRIEPLGEGGRVSQAAECLLGKRLDAVAGAFFPAVVQGYRERMGVADSHQTVPDAVFLAHLGEFAKRKSIGIIEMLRTEGITALDSMGRESIKSQLKIAERLGVDIALILGQKEAMDQTIIVRDVRSGMQEVMPQERLAEFLKKKMKR